MHTFVALLRGINVGGKKIVSMPELRSQLASIGLEDVTTYVQSGNVIFSTSNSNRQDVAGAIEERIGAAFDVSPSVLLRTPGELARVATANPFLERETDFLKLHVVFLSDAPSASAVAKLDPERSPPDEFSVRGSEIYLHLPNGSARSKLTIDYFEKQLGVRATARNWKTLTKLVELTQTSQ
jgi:uncharacterized protein (DUF1697 family)